ncbi:MAG: S-adenosylmethionine decarboxylase [Candidatus Paceibacterota bacterium]|jgi:S-adenosylmethionine decarboxylase
MHFGEHLMIDGYGGDTELLNSEALVRKILTELPVQLGMQTLAAPVIISAPDNDKKDPGGWSGFVVIAESHVSIHTFPKRGFVSIDVYTCRNGLDIETIKAYFTGSFALAELETNFVLRGKKYPQQNIHA